MFTKFKSSWRTSVLGALAFVAAACTALVALLDGRPETMPDWTLLGVTGANALNGLGLMFARDNSVTSEEAHGLKQPARIAEADKD